MKRFKKVTAFFLAVVMILAMNCTAFAANDIPFPDVSTEKKADISEHTFTAYQIFKGEVDKDGNLLKIDWGNGINASAFLRALQGDSVFGEGEANLFYGIQYDEKATNKSADAVARVMKEWGSDIITKEDGETIGTPSENSKLAREFARVADANRAAGTGKGKGENLDGGYYLVVDETQFTGDAEDTVRNLSFLQMGNNQPFNPVNKTDVPELEKKVKEKNDSDVTVTDKWGDVADYDIGDDVEFVLTGTLPSDYSSYKTYKYVFHDTLNAALTLNAKSIKVYIDDTEIKEGFTVATEDIGEDSLRVTFDNLKENTAVTATSVIRVAYTAKLGDANVAFNKAENKAHLEYSNDPNHDGTGTPPTGETPEDIVVVFSFKLVANKIGEDGKELSGAGFTLYKYNKESTATEEDAKYEIVGTEITNVTKFIFPGLDSGKYKLVETTVPSGYNKAEDMYFTIESTFDETNQKVTGLTIRAVTDKDGNEITDSKGEKVFTFTALGGDETLTDTLTSDIVNLKGILLPSTGGIGTTIFYVLGAILVVGAGVLLVVKKRMSKAE